MYLFYTTWSPCLTRRKRSRLQISMMESIIAMPFLAMKMDSSLPNLKNTTARITKNGRFTKTI